MRRFATLFFFFLIANELFAQKDLPNPPSDFQTIPAGSYVIAMDTANQKWAPAGQTIFNLKAYGLINQFLQNQIRVKWAIRAGKSLNGIDFTATASRVSPSTGPPKVMDFRGGPFIVPDTSICGQTTADLIQSFGNSVCVYRLINSVSVDIRYTITNAPKVAIFTNGGNQLVHAKILQAAGITNFDFMDAADIGNLRTCYTLVSEPHWDVNSADSVVVNGVKNFVINGGNFFAQCQALETYENYGFFATTNGINVINANFINSYHNPDLPILQINGLVVDGQGGSVQNYAPKIGSAYKSTSYKVISNNGGDTLLSVGMHLSAPTTIGGNAFFLGAHDYYGLNNLRNINAMRMYLNAVLMPTPFDPPWARAGMDQTINCTTPLSLGCTPAGPPGSTYLWTPSTGLSCDTCPNPVATPSTSINYTVTVTNPIGCTAKDDVQIASNVNFPIANFTANLGTGGTTCVNVPINFTDQSTNGAASWTWTFGDGSSSTSRSPSHAYSSSGTYTVTLSAANAFGCSSSIQRIVTVKKNPVADFKFTPACFGHVTCFTNQSSSSQGSIASYSWNFGDPVSGAANTSTLQNPCHNFNTASTNVILSVTSSYGCVSSDTLPITFAPDPVASFTSITSCKNAPTCFTSLSTVSSGSIQSYSWQFIDPAVNPNGVSTNKNPCYQYSSDTGLYAKLTITTHVGCQSTITLPVTYLKIPDANFSANYVCKGNATCFTNMSTIPSGSIVGYRWNFGESGSGGSNTSLLTNPCHTYLNSGTFNVQLIATSNLGCTDTIILPVKVAPKPVPNYTPSYACLGMSTCFTNSSTIAAGSSIANYNWSFTNSTNGSTDTSTQMNPCFLFASAGPYTVKLVVESDYGCKDSLSKIIPASPIPVASFTSNTTCPGTPTCFTNTSTVSSGSITKYQWDFHDPASGALNSSTAKNPCHIFQDINSKTVTLTITTSIGCQSTITLPVNFNALPTIDFTFSQTCKAMTTQFTESSSISSGSIISRTWDFGDTSVVDSLNHSILQNPTYKYKILGNYTVTLTEVSNLGCANTVTYTVPVTPFPKADFATTAVCQGEQTCFTNKSTISSGTISSYSWDFDDPASGSSDTSGLEEPCHIFNSLSTTYNVKLIVISDNGCSNSKSINVKVNPVPSATFTSTTVCPNTSTCFTGTATISTGSISAWSWNFSDPSSPAGSTANIQSPCHTFTNINNPVVSLIVTSAKGCNDTVSLPVAFNPFPYPDFNAPDVCKGSTTCFTGTTTLSTGTITSTLWNFGEPSSGASNSSSLTNPCHTFSTANNFNVTLQVSTNKGCLNNITKVVKVTPSPVVNFSSPPTCEGSQTCFNNLSTIPTGNIASYDWNFGDPSSGSNLSILQNPCHQYGALSNYTVTLTATSENNCTNSATRNIHISPLPIVNFNSTIVCAGYSTCFTNLTTITSGSISNYQWNFDDPISGSANSSTLTTPCHSFANLASPTVTLTATSDSGCTQTFSYPVTFNPVPVANFSLPASCYGTQTCVTDLSTVSSGAITGYDWDFDDVNSASANTSTIKNACHQFTSDGSFDVSLTVTSDHGCQSWISNTAIVYPVPTANFTPSSTCVGTQTNFIDSSIISSGTINSYHWNFGDPFSGTADTSSLQNPIHIFNSIATYNVSLIVTSDNGCEDTISAQVKAWPNPVANINATKACPGTATCFTDLSTVASGTITNWQWNFQSTSSSGNSTSMNPCYSFADTTASASLVITSDKGCTDSITTNVSFSPIPHADFQIPSACFGNQTCFTNLSSTSSGTITNYNWDFGDIASGTSDSSTSQNACHTFSSQGNFNVTLKVTSDNGCQNTISHTANVSPAPVANFTPLSTCEGSPTQFTNASAISSGSISSFYWDFGDPSSGTSNTSILQNPVHLFNSVIPYNVSLIVTSANGCKDTMNAPFNVLTKPVANISVTKVCPGTATCFTDLSTVASGTITNWKWNFHSNTSSDTSATQNPCYVFADTSANAKLVITSDKGCKDSITSSVLFNPVPHADFSMPPACLGSQTCFTNLASISSGTITNSKWNFGDIISGTSDSSASPNACHIFSSDGNFNVTLTVISDSGCQNTVSKAANVYPVPVASFTPFSACEGMPTQFTDASSISFGSINSFDWNFGDAPSGSSNTSSLENPVHLFSSAIPYNVSLIVTSANGCKDTLTAPVDAWPKPVANFTSTIVCPGSATGFTDMSTIASGNIASWNWNFNTNTTSDSSTNQNSYYAFAGTTANATLVITSDKGCSDSITSSVFFHPVPSADFSMSSACLGAQTCFTNLTSISSGTITSSKWNFGDIISGTSDTSATQNACHIFSSDGNFNVTLIVTSDSGCQNIVSHTADVFPVPVANFSPFSACEGMPTQFTDASSISYGSINSFDWNFGDAPSGSSNTSSLENPVHLFSSAIPYNVSLIVTSANGCKDTLTAPVDAWPKPVANFTSTIVCPGSATGFTDRSTIASGNIASWNWNFNSNTTSDSSTNQNSYYAFAGTTANATLVITSDKGCSDSITSIVFFHPVPSADFSTSAACLGAQTCFTNLTSISSGTITSSKWNFGDIVSGTSDTSATQNACHIFSSDGNFNVTLIVTSDSGCQNTVSHTADVFPVPVANFSPFNACEGVPTNFTDASVISHGTINSFDWNFGDPSSGLLNNSSLQNPVHQFTGMTPYNVSLIITSVNGCKDTLTAPVDVWSSPVANFLSTTVCPGTPTCFTDLSTVVTGNIANWTWNFNSASSSNTTTTQNPCNTFQDSTSSATLIVVSDKGCTDTLTSQVIFYPLPQPAFTPTATCFGIPSCFTNLSNISQGMVTESHWNFGDNNSGTNDTSNIFSPCHNFTAANTYHVNLQVTSDKGCSNSLLQDVKVLTKPVADFLADRVCINDPTEFINRSIIYSNDSINEWWWNFGDETHSSLQSPTHQYTSVQTYNVMMVISSKIGCKDTITVPVTVHAKPIANVATNQPVCGSGCDTYIDLSIPVNGTITSWNWLFPGGNPYSSTQQNPQVCYNAKGFYPLTLIATNSFGCSDTFYSAKHTKVFPVPEADFYVIKEPDNLYSPELTLGHIWSYDVTNWYWDFGDNTPVDSVHVDPSHTYTKPVTENDYYNFRVTLNVRNQFGCLARINREFNIKPAFSFFIPNTFTPNDDAPNDVFYGKGRGISEYKLAIFDRWGKLLWQCEEEGDFKEWDKDNREGLPSACKWDGIMNGRIVQNDTYVWKVELKNVFGEWFKYVGHVNVVK